MVAEIVAAHLSNNTVTMTEIPRLINEVYAALNNLGQAQGKAAERQEPAIPLKKSVTADYIVCLEDGKKLKMLKRHLRTAYGLTPEQYREKWACRRIIRWWRRITPRSAAPWPGRSAWAPAAAAASAACP